MAATPHISTGERLASLEHETVTVHDPNERGLIGGPLRIVGTHFTVLSFKWAIKDIEHVNHLKREIILSINTKPQKDR